MLRRQRLNDGHGLGMALAELEIRPMAGCRHWHLIEGYLIQKHHSVLWARVFIKK